MNSCSIHDAKRIVYGAMIEQHYLKTDSELVKHDVVLCKFSRFFYGTYNTGISRVIGKF